MPDLTNMSIFRKENFSQRQVKKLHASLQKRLRPKKQGNGVTPWNYVYTES